jgi:hypothetical protein
MRRIGKVAFSLVQRLSQRREPNLTAMIKAERVCSVIPWTQMLIKSQPILLLPSVQENQQESQTLITKPLINAKLKSFTAILHQLNQRRESSNQLRQDLKLSLIETQRTKKLLNSPPTFLETKIPRLQLREPNGTRTQKNLFPTHQDGVPKTI